MKARTARKTADDKPAPREGRRDAPAILYRDGKPAFVLLDIRTYRKMLDRLDDYDDVVYLASLEDDGADDRPLDEVLAEIEGR